MMSDDGWIGEDAVLVIYEQELALCNHDERLLWENKQSQLTTLRAENERLREKLKAHGIIDWDSDEGQQALNQDKQDPPEGES